MSQLLEDALCQAEQFISEGEQRCTRLRLLIARQAAHGEDTAPTEALLRRFENNIAAVHDYRFALFRKLP